jgi:hypothetical protein
MAAAEMETPLLAMVTVSRWRRGAWARVFALGDFEAALFLGFMRRVM